MGQETILIIIKQEAERGSILGQCLLGKEEEFLNDIKNPIALL